MGGEQRSLEPNRPG